MNTINSWIKRNPLITAIICILAVVMLTGFISLRTNSFQNPNALFERKRNEENLLQPGEDGNYLLTEQKVSKENMTVTPKANGALVISGYNKYGEGSYLEYDVATVTLKKPLAKKALPICGDRLRKIIVILQNTIRIGVLMPMITKKP